jgi:hypothetical protein
MIPYDLDPSLHTGQPEPPKLDDGFSPPAQAEANEHATPPEEPVDPTLWTKSAF